MRHNKPAARRAGAVDLKTATEHKTSHISINRQSLEHNGRCRVLSFTVYSFVPSR